MAVHGKSPLLPQIQPDRTAELLADLVKRSMLQQMRGAAAAIAFFYEVFANQAIFVRLHGY